MSHDRRHPPTSSAWSSRAGSLGPALGDNVLRSRELSHPPGAAGRDRGGDDQDPELPVQQQRLARPAAHPVDPAAARRRTGGGDHHPQRRPVGRLGARRSRPTSPGGCSSTHPASRSSSWSLPAIVVGGLLGPGERAAGRLRQGAGLVITLGTLYIFRGVGPHLGRQRPHQRLGHAPRASSTSAPRHPRDPGAVHRRRRRSLAGVGYYLHTARGGREMYAIGSDPDAAVLYGLNVRRRLLAAFVLSGALAGSGRRPLHRALRHGQLGRRHRHRAGGGRRRRHRRRRDLRRQRHRRGARRSALCSWYTINRALPILGIPDFWQRAVVGVLIIGAIVLDRVLGRAAGPQAASRRGTSRDPTTVMPTHSRDRCGGDCC